MPPLREDFARWREDPVTRWVMTAMKEGAAQQRALWEDASWTNGHANPLLLNELRTRADAYVSISEASYEDFCEHMGEDPRDE